MLPTIVTRPTIKKKILIPSLRSEVKISPVAVKSEEILSLPPVEEMAEPAPRAIEGVCVKYDKLGLHWERCKLDWDIKTGKKKGISQNMGKFAEGNGVILHCEGLLAIDIDGDCDKCREIYELCDAECVMKAKTRKGHHFFFKADTRFKQSTGEAVKIDLRTGKPSIVLVEPSFYLHPDGVVLYKWERFPNTMDEVTACPKEVCEWLLTDPRYCSDSAPPMKVKRPVVAKEVENEIIYPVKPKKEDDKEVMRLILSPPNPITQTEQVEALCNCLTPEWIGEHTNWLRLMYAMKNISASAEMREIFLRHSARAPQFDTPTFYKQNGKGWDGLKAGGRSGLGSVKHWAKKCNPEMYFRLAKGSYESLVKQDNMNGYCEIFYTEMAGDIMYSMGHKCYYIYDDNDTLWKKAECSARINFQFVEVISAVFRKMMSDLPVAKDEEEASRRKAQMKRLMDASKTCGGGQAVMMVSNFLPALCIPTEDPALYFNQNPDLLPLLNGVYKFSEKKLIPYEREQYFTFRIPISYNPNADMTKIRKAALDWFGQDKEVAKFIQMWIGYCLTGHTTRQDFLVVWGTKAGNGKSFLWGDILSALLGEYYHTITSDALSTERMGNNDQLYNLNGKRFAFLSEPRKAKGTKIDNEIVKTLTGDKYFTVEAKYKNALTFRLSAKFAMACNNMPEYEFEDKGTYRRVKVVEQNTQFLDPAEYAVAEEALKDSKKIMMKDDDFVKALLENTEALMLWALQGADLFTDNPRMEAPNAMNSAKKKAVKEVDVMGAWIEANLRNLSEVDEKDRDLPKNAPFGADVVSWEKRKVTFKKMKDRLRDTHTNIGQREMGWNKKMKEKFEEAGFTVGGREDKGDLYVKGADFYPDIDEE